MVQRGSTKKMVYISRARPSKNINIVLARLLHKYYSNEK